MILVFTGHMIDADGRRAPRYPAWLEQDVGNEIQRLVRELGPSSGYGAAACGSDIQFLEAVLAIGKQPQIVLPFPKEDFVETSVAFAGKQWVGRFERLTQTCPVTEVTDDPFLGEDDLYEYGFEVMLGMALKEGERRAEAVTVLVALDAGSASLVGGTKAMLDQWRPRGLNVVEIRVGDLRKKNPGKPVRNAHKLPAPALRSRRVPENLVYERVRRTMLFADVKGYGQLSEVQSPAFFIHFLNAVHSEMADSQRGPVFSNTWGDGLYLVFEEIVAAADFALRLRDHMCNADWAGKGLPRDLAIRIGMHTGPVFYAHDPIVGAMNWFGAHVNRAARIEPLVAPNRVWCSEQAAAVLAAQMIPDYRTNLLGAFELPKEAGVVPLYDLSWANE